MKNLDWQYKDQWNKASNQTWMVDGSIAGSYQTYANLTFLQVLGAGHLVFNIYILKYVYT